MKKILAMVLALCMCLCAVSALAETDSEAIKAKGTLVVGITDFAPMDYLDADGTTWIGIDADLARAFAETLGVAVEFVEIDWDNKILELNAGTVDCIWNGMTLTDEVAAAMNCTVAYLDNAQVIVMPADKVAELSGLEGDELLAAINALDNITYAVEAGSAGEAVADEIGLAKTSVATQAAALMEVAAGTSDAAIIDMLMAIAMTGEGTGYANLAPVLPLTEEQYVIGFRTGSDMTDLCNAFLNAASEDGSLNAIINKYLAE